jgi:pre-mRNA cleavage complex 2 protein Pcf11
LLVFRFDIENKPHVLHFVEALSTVLINGHPTLIVVCGKKHFIRFTELPRGIRPGYINIINMEGGRLLSHPPLKNDSSDTVNFGGENSSDMSSRFTHRYDPVLPVIGKYLFSVL